MIVTLNNGETVWLELIDDFYILLEQDMGREVREWLENKVDEMVDDATEANWREDV